MDQRENQVVLAALVLLVFKVFEGHQEEEDLEELLDQWESLVTMAKMERMVSLAFKECLADQVHWGNQGTKDQEGNRVQRDHLVFQDHQE